VGPDSGHSIPMVRRQVAAIAAAGNLVLTNKDAAYTQFRVTVSSMQSADPTREGRGEFWTARNAAQLLLWQKDHVGDDAAVALATKFAAMKAQ